MHCRASIACGLQCPHGRLITLCPAGVLSLELAQLRLKALYPQPSLGGAAAAAVVALLHLAAAAAAAAVVAVGRAQAWDRAAAGTPQ